MLRQRRIGGSVGFGNWFVLGCVGRSFDLGCRFRSGSCDFQFGGVASRTNVAVLAARHDFYIERRKDRPVRCYGWSFFGSPLGYNCRGHLFLRGVRLNCLVGLRSGAYWSLNGGWSFRNISFNRRRTVAEPEIAIFDQNGGQRSQQQNQSEKESAGLLASHGDSGLGIGGPS